MKDMYIFKYTKEIVRHTQTDVSRNGLMMSAVDMDCFKISSNSSRVFNQDAKDRIGIGSETYLPTAPVAQS